MLVQIFLHVACNSHYYRHGDNYALPNEKLAKDSFRGCHFVFHSFRLYHLPYLRSSKYGSPTPTADTWGTQNADAVMHRLIEERSVKRLAGSEVLSDGTRVSCMIFSVPYAVWLTLFFFDRKSTGGLRIGKFLTIENSEIDKGATGYTILFYLELFCIVLCLHYKISNRHVG